MGKYIRVGKRAFTLIELMIVVAIIGILASLAIYGVRKYIANSKTAEARNSIGQIGKDAQTAYEKESMGAGVLAASGTTSITRALCFTATASVPSSSTLVKGMKYQSNQAYNQDWGKDVETAGVGFACLKFTMSAPQYYMYTYNSPTTSGSTAVFTAIANGDLNGDGTMSTFSLIGAVSSDLQLYVAPSIAEIDPEE